MAQVLDTDVVVRGGQSPLPEPGTPFSGSYGRTLEEAGAAVPYGTIRATTAGAIRAGGGSVEWEPDLTRSGVLNENHVNIVEGEGPSVFSELFPNPVPKSERIQ